MPSEQEDLIGCGWFNFGSSRDGLVHAWLGCCGAGEEDMGKSETLCHSAGFRSMPAPAPHDCPRLP